MPAAAVAVAPPTRPLRPSSLKLSLSLTSALPIRRRLRRGAVRHHRQHLNLRRSPRPRQQWLKRMPERRSRELPLPPPLRLRHRRPSLGLLRRVHPHRLRHLHRHRVRLAHLHRLSRQPLPTARDRGRSCPAPRVLAQSRLELRSSRHGQLHPLRRVHRRAASPERVATIEVHAPVATIVVDAAEEKESEARSIRKRCRPASHAL